MSWSPDLIIGELRPWPDSVVVTRGSRLDSRIYVPQEALTAKELRECHVMAENAKLRELCVKALEWLRWAGGITCPPEVPDEFADELRELGIEVSE